MIDRERLFGILEGSRKLILVEPQAILTESSRMPGLDGPENVQDLWQLDRFARR